MQSSNLVKALQKMVFLAMASADAADPAQRKAIIL
jgi:hypothetical protein